jgi:hypothetical protein
LARVRALRHFGDERGIFEEIEKTISSLKLNPGDDEMRDLVFREAAEAAAYPPEELLAFVDDDAHDPTPAAAPGPDDSMRELLPGEIKPDPGPLPRVKRKATADPRVAAAVERAERTSKAREGTVIEDEMPDTEPPSVAASGPGPAYDPLDPPEITVRMGRPSKYDPKFVDIVRGIAKLGATDDQVADCLSVSITTISLWKVQYPEFLEALKAGKDEADARVERTLYQRAVGYQRDAVKIFHPADAPGPVYAPFREEVPGDVTAQIFWLKNRRRDEWRDVKSQELSGVNGAPIQMGASDDMMAAARKIAFAMTTALERAAAAGRAAEIQAASTEIKTIEGQIVTTRSSEAAE